jgi:hypothetical protein
MSYLPNGTSGADAKALCAEDTNRPAIARSGRVFFMSCRVDVNIRADPAHIWQLLTDAEDFPRWNSTVADITGQIREGERIRLRVPGIKRTFTPTVSGVIRNERMIWTDGVAAVFKGVRTFALKAREEGSTDFTMDEHFSGPLLPLIRGSMPDPGPIFLRYAADLKREAETTKQGA